MAKKKGGKKKGKKKKAEPDPNALTEVDKTFYELQIADLNRKLARLRTLTTEQEEKNGELQQNLSQLDEDRNDIIVFLKRMLQEKSNEITELSERLTAVEETRQNETEEYQEKINTLEVEYKQMHEQLTSEVKLLEGKINSLEEFRGQREELMGKYERMEKDIEEQEVRHKRELYEIERKFIIAKDHLKKEMEARLLQLSTEFNDATEIRIAATTHRVIRENVAINNELDSMLNTHNRLYYENKKHRANERTNQQHVELLEAEKNKALGKIKAQTNIIERLTVKYETMEAQIEAYKKVEEEMYDYSRKLIAAEEKITKLNYTNRLLEQNLHASRVERAGLKTEAEKLRQDLDVVNDTLYEAVMSIKGVLKVQKEPGEDALKVSRRESLLHTLLDMLTKVEELKKPTDSLETVSSLSSIYAKGDLGFVPKPVVLRSRLPIKRNVSSQVGASFEEFLPATSETVVAIQKLSSMAPSDIRQEDGPSEPDMGGGRKRSILKAGGVSEITDESIVFVDNLTEPSTQGEETISELESASTKLDSYAESSAPVQESPETAPGSVTELTQDGTELKVDNAEEAGSAVASADGDAAVEGASLEKKASPAGSKKSDSPTATTNLSKKGSTLEGSRTSVPKKSSSEKAQIDPETDA